MMMRSLHIFYRLAVLFAAFVLAGCMEKSHHDLAERLVTLQVSLDVKATKADPEDAEKTINSIRIYAYRSDTGGIVGHYYRGNASSEPIYMDLALPERGQYEVEFYVLVNEVSVRMSEDFHFTERLTKEQLKQVSFTSVDQSGAIPLYGVNTVTIDVDNVSEGLNTAPGHEDHYLLIQKVSLTLSSVISKLSVYAAMAEGVTATRIHYVGILKGGLRQYMYFMPADDQTLASVPSRAIGRDLMTTETILTKNAASGSLDDNDYDLLVSGHYIPETEVGSEFIDVKADDRQTTIHVQYSVGEGGELRNGYIYMPRIERNTHYNVRLLITSEGRIILGYTVADWDEEDMTELWFDYPTHSFIESGSDDTKPQNPATMSSENPFVGYFKMTYPINETWRPTILGENSGKVTVKVYNGVNEVVPPVAADPDNWYKIMVIPDPDLEEGKEVELSVTYSPKGSVDGQYEFLLINGSQNNWYWPYEGASKQDANKVIITVKE